MVHLVGGKGVEPRDGLVEQQQLSGGTQGAREQHALLLSARKLAVAVLGEVLDAELFHVALGQGALFPAVEGAQPHAVLAAREHDLAHRGREVALHLGLLRQIADLPRAQAVGKADRPADRRLQSQQRAHERGLAGAVFAHNAEIIPGVHLKTQPAQQPGVFIAQGQLITDDLCHTGASFSSAPFSKRRDFLP